MTYLVRAQPSGQLWHVEVPVLDRVTQARNAREIETMATDLISIMTDEQDPSVEIEFVLAQNVRGHLDAATQARETETRARAALEIRLAARALHNDGLPLRDVGIVLGVSGQRAHQLVS